ncbi:MAG: flagellar motor protein MotB [Proteobacteria bacterium]|nr:flagellar motor protein MotB [Pseudomonadota bacterium]
MAVKAKCPEFENHERWLVSYADMVTMLFALFVVLFAQKMGCKESKAAATATSQSIQDALNTPLPEIPIDRKVGPTVQGMGIFDNFKGDQLREPLSQRYPSSKQRTRVIDMEMKRVRALVEERLYGPEKYPQGGDKGQERVVSIERTAQGFKLQLAARHFFGSGEYQVRREALKELNDVGDILMELGKPIVVEGHTDSVPSSGTFSNWEISGLRAASIVKYLVNQTGFPSTKISMAGYANLRPISQDSTEAGRAMNRRIEIHINYDQDVGIDPTE